MTTARTKAATKATHANNEAVREKLRESMHTHAAHEHTMFRDGESFTARYELADGKRRLLGWVLALIAGLGTASLASSLAEMAVVGAYMVTGSAVLTLLVYVVSLVLSIYASMQAFCSVLDYVVSSRPNDHMRAIGAGFNKALAWAGLNRHTNVGVDHA